MRHMTSPALAPSGTSQQSKASCAWLPLALFISQSSRNTGSQNKILKEPYANRNLCVVHLFTNIEASSAWGREEHT